MWLFWLLALFILFFELQSNMYNVAQNNHHNCTVLGCQLHTRVDLLVAVYFFTIVALARYMYAWTFMYRSSHINFILIS